MSLTRAFFALVKRKKELEILNVGQITKHRWLSQPGLGYHKISHWNRILIKFLLRVWSRIFTHRKVIKICLNCIELFNFYQKIWNTSKMVEIHWKCSKSINNGCNWSKVYWISHFQSYNWHYCRFFIIF